MNIYFLVEGQAELGVYPTWINALFESKLSRNLAFDDVSNNEYFIHLGGGVGKMVHRGIKDAVQDIANHPVYDWFVIIVDTNNQDVADRLALIENVFAEPHFPNLPTGCQIKIIVQNRCFETWLCGHTEAYTLAQNSANKNIQRFINFYDSKLNDPELMDKDSDVRFAHLTIAKYHAIYLQHVLLPKKYNKGTASTLIDVNYLENLQERLVQTPTHLVSFNAMISFFQTLKRLL
jgi:hypothetical protein